MFVAPFNSLACFSWTDHYETFGTFQLIIANYKRLCLHPRVYQDKSVAVYKTMARTVAILPVSIRKAFFM